MATNSLTGVGRPMIPLLLLAVLLLAESGGANLIRGGGAAAMKARKEFDYFTLALTWSGTSCMNVKECCSINGCCRNDVDTGFTIRSLWPDYNDGTYPTCCTGSQFDENQLLDIMNELNEYWPHYYCTNSSACGSPKGSIWAYQWVKHGSCASPVLQSPYEYFAMAMWLYTKYNVTDVLMQAGYVPSNTESYPLEGIISAIKNAYGVTPIVSSCYIDAIKEVQLCFNKSFKPIECPAASSVGSKKNSECPELVKLPIKNVPKMMKSAFRGVLGRFPIISTF